MNQQRHPLCFLLNVVYLLLLGQQSALLYAKDFVTITQPQLSLFLILHADLLQTLSRA